MKAENVISFILIMLIFLALIHLGFQAIDTEMANRESHYRIHRHDLLGGGRGR